MSSLTAPWDKTEEQKQSISQSVSLTNEQVDQAVPVLYDTSFTDKFPRSDKMYADPIYNNQVYCLHSFVPSKGAQPDEHGVFGFMKFRGAFQTIEEANQRAEFLIRHVDSYHNIQTGYAGRPFPVCYDTKKFVKETKEVDIRKQAMETISGDIQEKRLQEKKEIEEMKEREKKLLEESKAAQEGTYEQDPMEVYIMLHVKKANLIFTYKETQQKMEQMKKSLKNTWKEIVEMDEQHPTFSKEYYERYMNARKVAGIPKESQDNFMNYMGDDIKLDFEYK